ncbi:hypothetical protein L7F22_064146 [Adiantum nelumboides]|nr:hypothetical protein [Adiantum nelumboides]
MVPPLNRKRKVQAKVPELDDEDELPIQHNGPTITGPSSVNISNVPRSRPPRHWYIKGPPVPLPPGIHPIIQNLVCTINVGCQLEVSEIPKTARNCEYKPKSFGACIMRLKEPKATALMFGTGRVVVTGTRAVKRSQEAGRKFVQILKKHGYPNAKYQDYAIQNVVAVCDVNFAISLESLYHDRTVKTQYESANFPGLILRMADPKMVFLVFHSGKIVSTGLKDPSLVKVGFEKAYNIVSRHKKGPPKDNPWDLEWVLK